MCLELLTYQTKLRLTFESWEYCFSIFFFRQKANNRIIYIIFAPGLKAIKCLFEKYSPPIMGLL